MDDSRLSYPSSSGGAPLPPMHDADFQPQVSISKSMQRAKTVRGIRDFFKKKDSGETTRTRDARDARSLSNASQSSFHDPIEEHGPYNPSSSSPPAGESNYIQAVDIPSESTSLPMSRRTSIPEEQQDKALLPQEIEQLSNELQLIKKDIEKIRGETKIDEEKKKELEAQLQEARRELEKEKHESNVVSMKLLRLESDIKATDDDLGTIQEKYKRQIKHRIQHAIMTLVKSKREEKKVAEKAVAFQFFSQRWPHLNLQSELEPIRINQLAEKFVHENVRQKIFEVSIYPGLDINRDFDIISHWLLKHNSKFTLRLRQQLAAVVAKSRDVLKSSESEKNRIIDEIYHGLEPIYAPFLEKKEDQDKFRQHLDEIVSRAMELVLAIRGQKAKCELLTVHDEGQPFDENTMEAAYGKTEGNVYFWICPPFQGQDNEDIPLGFLEKGKVVVRDA